MMDAGSDAGGVVLEVDEKLPCEVLLEKAEGIEIERGKATAAPKRNE